MVMDMLRSVLSKCLKSNLPNEVVLSCRLVYKMKGKVDFIICGTQKGGTSALDAYLREHPEICMAENKEVHFFDNEDLFNTDAPNYSVYHSSFSPKGCHRLVGEATPIYIYWYDAPRRIWRYNPGIKLIVILRNPIERAYSHWNMEHSRNADELSFWGALTSERDRCRKALPYQHRVYSYIDRGRYLEQLRRLWTYFPKEQVLILKNEELRHQLHETLRQVCDFLGIDVAPLISIKQKEVHARPYLSPISKREREYLQFIFEHEILSLERVLGWDCSNWLSD